MDTVLNYYVMKKRGENNAIIRNSNKKESSINFITIEHSIRSLSLGP